MFKGSSFLSFAYLWLSRRSRSLDKQFFSVCTRSQSSQASLSSSLPCPGSSSRKRNTESPAVSPTRDHSVQPGNFDNDYLTTDESFLAKCAEGRRRINTLWSEILGAEAVRMQDRNRESFIHSVTHLIESLAIDPGSPIEGDISKGLGESLDRLLILTVKATAWHMMKGVVGEDGNVASPSLPSALPKLLRCVSRHGIALDIKTVQHMFSSCYNYSQALNIFEEVKLCGMKMDAGVYYSMLYCLQKLDEESWGRTFHQERMATQRTSVAAMKFVLHGIDGQLLPESKPHIGRVMYSDVSQAFPSGKSHDYDASGKEWNQRYHQN